MTHRQIFDLTVWSCTPSYPDPWKGFWFGYPCNQEDWPRAWYKQALENPSVQVAVGSSSEQCDVQPGFGPSGSEVTADAAGADYSDLQCFLTLVHTTREQDKDPRRLAYHAARTGGG